MVDTDKDYLSQSKKGRKGRNTLFKVDGGTQSSGTQIQSTYGQGDADDDTLTCGLSTQMQKYSQGSTLKGFP